MKTLREIGAWCGLALLGCGLLALVVLNVCSQLGIFVMGLRELFGG